MSEYDEHEAFLNYEEFSKLQLRERLLSVAKMRRLMKGRRLLALSKAVQFIRNDESVEDNVVIGVVVCKTKLYVDDKPCLLLRLAHPAAVRSVSLFTFGQGRGEKVFSGTVPGDVVALVNPGLIKMKEEKEPALMATIPKLCLKVGKCRDFDTRTGLFRDPPPLVTTPSVSRIKKIGNILERPDLLLANRHAGRQLCAARGIDLDDLRNDGQSRMNFNDTQLSRMGWDPSTGQDYVPPKEQELIELDTDEEW